jgi:hypothetical protein
MTKELVDRLSPIGRIVLYFYFIEHLEAVRPAEIPQLANNHFGVLSEKALHKAAAIQGDQLSHHTRYALHTLNTHHGKGISLTWILAFLIPSSEILSHITKSRRLITSLLRLLPSTTDRQVRHMHTKSSCANC